MIAIKKILLLTSLLLTAADSMEQMDPPIWPDQWHANFSIERWGNTWLSQSKNKGSYHYDWKKGRSLEEHGKGQKDNWCGCASKKVWNARSFPLMTIRLARGRKIQRPHTSSCRLCMCVANCLRESEEGLFFPTG